MYCLFQSSGRPLDDLDEVEKFVEKTITTDKVDIDKDMKATLCGAIGILWATSQTTSSLLKCERKNGKLSFLYANFYSLLTSECLLRLILLPKKQYKVRIEENCLESFRSIGFLMTNNNQDLIKILQYLCGIIECAKIVEKKIQQNIIMQEFIKKNMRSFGSVGFPLRTIKFVVLEKIVKIFFKKSEIKTKKEMDNLKKHIQVDVKEYENQTEKITVKMSSPTGGFSSKAILYCEKNCFGVKFTNEKNFKTWRIFQDGVITKYINELSVFNKEMNERTGLNKKYGKVILEKKLKQPIKTHNAVNKEMKKATGLEQKKQILQNKMEQHIKDQSNFDKKRNEAAKLDKKYEKKTKQVPMKLVVIIMILLTTLFCVLSFVGKYKT